MSEDGDGKVVAIRRSIPRGTRRLNQIEDRLYEQEKATRNLIEKAYELKESISKDIRPSGMDSALQQLWHDHIRTITSTVKKLARDLEDVKYELASRDSFQADSNVQTKSIEQFAQAGVSDLRGRVARCDISIARLAQEFRGISSTSQLEKQQVNSETESNKQKTKQLEKEISELTRRVDGILTQHEGKIEVIKGSSTSQIEAMDSKIKWVIEDIRISIDSNRKWSESERSRIENQISQILELNSSLAQSKQDALEHRLTEKIEHLQRTVEDCKLDVSKCREEIRNTYADKEKIDIRMKKQNERFEEEMSRLKSEYREGFASVKESIDTTNRLINGKIKLVKDELTRDLTTIKKMVVLI